MERMEKQTAVEWLVEQLGEYFPHEIGGIHLMIEKAKEMFEQQIIDAWENGFREFYDGSSTPEEYYNENYGK
jgi:hypothetical protein